MWTTKARLRGAELRVPVTPRETENCSEATQGRYDLAVIGSFVGMLVRTVSKIRMERDLPERAWDTFAMEALPLLDDQSMKRLDGSSPDDVQDAIESKDPKDKVFELKILKANSEGLETNHEGQRGGR